MNTSLRFAALTLAVGISGTAHAALYDRGGGLIYDSALNVTWMKDANYAKTSGYDADGLMTWSQSMTWAANLGYYDSVRGVTYTDWRLPDGKPLNGVSHITAYSYNGSTDIGTNISAPGTVYAGSQANEMAYMYYQTLGNAGQLTPSNAYTNCVGAGLPGTCLENAGPFINFVKDGLGHWTQTTWTSDSTRVEWFTMQYGDASWQLKSNSSYAWAVRPGDVSNMAPIAVSGSPLYAVAKDGLVTLAASGYDPDPYMGDTITGYAWDLNGDGIYGDLSGTSATTSWASLTGMGLLAGQDYAISLRVSDSKGAYGYTSATLQIAAIPEPETYAMMLAGLGLVGFAARRQRGARG